MHGAMIDIFLVIFGVLGIAGGIFGKDFRQADSVALHEFKGDSKMPTWLGRVLFIVAGTGLVAIGIKLLVEGK
jgi:hypothetical protein